MLGSRAQRRAAAWLQEVVASRAVYHVVAAIVAGSRPTADEERIAGRVPLAIWTHVLALEACGAWLDGARRRWSYAEQALAPAASLLRATSADAVRSALLATQQVGEIAEVAADLGVRLLVLKGMARLLAGEAPGGRSMSDIDLLVSPESAPLLHAALQSKLGYVCREPGTPRRHLPSLARATGLPVEVHGQVSDGGSPALERRMWAAPRRIAVGRCSVEIPDATALLEHALEHAVVVHRAARFRLRDVLDVSALATNDVDWIEVSRYAADHADRDAVWTLLRAASGVPGARSGPPAPPTETVQRQAWRRIRRVGRARLLAPARADVPPGADPRVMVLSQLAQGSPQGVLRLAWRAMRRPGRAVQLVSGRWLPVEAEPPHPREEPPVRPPGR